jgi:hypothetical protein
VNREFFKGVMIGVGLAAVAPMVFPVVARAARPALQAAIRAGVNAYEKSRESLAELGEYAEDAIAEARAAGPAGAAADRPAQSANPQERG